MMKLMIPGPVPLLPAASEALGAPVQAHYGPAWMRQYEDLQRLLHLVFRTEGDIFCLVGSGTAGIDAALSSLLGPGQTLVVAVTGFHSQRLALMARRYGAEVVEVVSAWGQPVLPEAIGAALERARPPLVVAVAHVETTTGVQNPVEAIARVARDHAALMLVDAVASLGGVEFAMDEWGVDVCCSASQKCLGGAPGLAPVAVTPRAWSVIDAQPTAGRSWYLDLRVWRQAAREWHDWHPYPVTVPTNLMLALRAGLAALAQDGLAERNAYYRALAARLRAGVRQLGLDPFVADEWAAPVVTAVCAPAGTSSSEIVAYLEREHDIKISVGFGPVRDQVFRIGHMGPMITGEDIDSVLGALGAFLGNTPGTVHHG